MPELEYKPQPAMLSKPVEGKCEIALAEKSVAFREVWIYMPKLYELDPDVATTL